MSATRIISFQTVPPQPPIPQRTRPARLRALPQFASIVMWIASAILQRSGEDVTVVRQESIAPALRDQVEEETLRTLAALDPIAESVARRRARQRAGELLAQMVTEATADDLAQPGVFETYATRIADAVLERYRAQLIYGAPSAPEVNN